MNEIRNEYPRPQFRRKDWENLNGKWNFAFDDYNVGLKEQWYKNPERINQTIQVPFAYQTELSGIHDPSFHDVVWYHRTFEIPEGWEDQLKVIHFGAVDYWAKVYVNGELVGEHEGGNTTFSIDITHVAAKKNDVVVRVEDPSTDATIPRGKQYWHEESASIFYTRTTGIWQTVWLEPLDPLHMDQIRWTPQLDRGDIDVEIDVYGHYEGATAEIEITYRDQMIVKERSDITNSYMKRSFHLRNRITDRSNIHGAGWYWTPEHPNLFDVTLRIVKDDHLKDEVISYFGMRKVSIEDGVFKLNNQTYYQKLVLDQGYFPKGLLTAPSDTDLKKDIELSKEMGFNGARKHQKVEDPRYLYWADQLGFLVWGEMANASEFSEEAVRRITKEWTDVVKRDYSHPSIVAWLPLNESWGISRVAREEQQQYHSLGMYYLTKSLDPTRPALSNDGWEHTVSDICGIHNYRSAEKMAKTYATVENAITTTPADRPIYAKGYAYKGEPILITEYGGIAYKMDETEGWGYSSVQSGEDLVEEYRKQTSALLESSVIQGFCYTQLTDVEQEINGLLTYDREPKCSLEEIKKINESDK